jgi:peptide/nickel transport system substrate-binding protein
MSPSSGYFYNPNAPQYDFDAVKAKKLLAEAGFSDKNGDGFVEDSKGNTVEFSLVTNSGNTVRKQIGEIIGKDLKNLGFNVHFNQLEFNTLIAKLDANYDWEACIMGLTGGIEPHFGVNVWRSSGNLHMWWPRQKIPATAWEKRIDKIYELAVAELDPVKRKAYYDEWQVIVAENLPLIHTVLAERLIALRNKFENVNPAPYGGVLHNLDEIYVK